MRSTCNCSAACGSCRPFRRWFRAEALLLGWAAGIVRGSWTAWGNGLKPLATLDLGGTRSVFYVGLGALILNIVGAAIANVIVARVSPERRGVIARS
jgi:SSS family solute:Na+ symporter